MKTNKETEKRNKDIKEIKEMLISLLLIQNGINKKKLRKMSSVINDIYTIWEL